MQAIPPRQTFPSQEYLPQGPPAQQGNGYQPAPGTSPYSQQTYTIPGPPVGHHALAARGLGQMFGIHPSIIMLTFIIDIMLFGGEAISFGGILPLSFCVALVLAVITYLGQVKWYRDDKESAIIKSLILGLLTAIPTALPAVLYIPSGIVGLVHWFKHHNDPKLPY